MAVGGARDAVVGTRDAVVGGEGGVLFPGNAFSDAQGRVMQRVVGGRFMLQFRL